MYNQPCSSRSPVVAATNTPVPVRSFKEAVTSPARLPASFFDCNTFEKRLAEAELSLEEYKQNFWELDQEAEALNRERRQLNLILHSVQDTAKENVNGLQALGSMLNKCTPDGRTCEDTEWMQEQLGTYQNRYV